MTTKSPNASVLVRWDGDGRFDVARAEKATQDITQERAQEALQQVTARLDSSGATGPSPLDALLSALGACASVDVVEILAKRRTPVAALSVDVVGERVETIPRRLKHVTLHFSISGEGIERAQAERAIELSVTKYCSVRDSLRQDIAVDWTLTLGAPGTFGASLASPRPTEGTPA